MGIVVTIAMLLGLVVLRATPWRADDTASLDLRFVVFTSCYLLLAGLWNSVWHGLRHLNDFWGWAAIVSGVAMILAAIIIFLERSDSMSIATSWLGSIRTGVVWVLIACFLLYAVTLIQLNLGFKIIG